MNKLSKRFTLDPSCKFYLPLWECDGLSLPSRDAAGRLCTVTGAVRGYQGRDLDGIDDYILALNSSLSFGTGPFCVMVWFRWLDARLYSYIVSVTNGTGSPGVRLSLAIAGTGNAIGAAVGELYYFNGIATDLTGVVLSPNVIYCIQYRRAGTGANQAQIILNGQIVWTGTRNTNITPTDRVYLGCINTSDGHYLSGFIGEVAIFSDLALAELQNLYLATKWRYR